jgi:hypothetical protein
VVKASDIDVDTEGIVVTLTGDVRSADERRRAVRGISSPMMRCAWKRDRSIRRSVAWTTRA